MRLILLLSLVAACLSAQTYSVGATAIPANTLVQLNATTGLAAPLGSGGIYAGIALASASSNGTVSLTTSGVQPCIFENATTPGDLVILGTSTYSDCRDSGATSLAAIAAGTRVLGTVQAAVSSGQSANVVLGRLDVYGTLSGGGGGSSTRTWSFAAFGVCQASLAGAAIWVPTSNAPVFNSCTSTNQQGEWTIPAANTTTNWGLQFPVPAGVTGSWTATLIWRTADTTTSHAITLQASYSCVAAGASPDNPSYTSLSTITLNPVSTASINQSATLTFTPTCAAASQFRLLLTPTANTFTSPAQFSFESVAVQALN
jgi:hypothetical protein